MSLLGMVWEWWPIFELQVGQTYRMHIASIDWQHGFSLQPKLERGGAARLLHGGVMADRPVSI